MTLSSLLSKDPTSIPSLIDRGEHYSPPWKGSSKGGTQSALSALTLLAFLFFLNLLQNCLRDQLQNQAPLTIMMTTTTTTTTTEAQRLKREAQMSKGDTAQKVDNKFGDFPKFLEEDYKIFVKNDANRSGDSKKEVPPDSADKLTAWIYDQVCCTNCAPWQSKDKGEDLENYLRKSVVLFCGLFEADSMKNHKNCGNDHEYCSNQDADKVKDRVDTIGNGIPRSKPSVQKKFRVKRKKHKSFN